MSYHPGQVIPNPGNARQAYLLSRLSRQHNAAQEQLEYERLARALREAEEYRRRYPEGPIPRHFRSKNSRHLHAKTQKRKIHKGPRGGKFYMNKGKKVYI